MQPQAQPPESSPAMKIIAHIHTEFPDKFGIPRQSGVVPQLQGEIVFAPHYRNENALRGLEGFSHIWLLWEFSQAVQEDWSPTVRPPRLGGNIRQGVFATRSPYRPNPIGLSCVKLEEIILQSPLGPLLRVSGADLLDGTPIYDIKPYLPFVDCRPEATGGFAAPLAQIHLEVEIPEPLLQLIPPARQAALRAVLAQDPRPSYQHDPTRVYGLTFAELSVKFTVAGDILTVCGVETR